MTDEFNVGIVARIELKTLRNGCVCAWEFIATV